jgi:hypothetical protein
VFVVDFPDKAHKEWTFLNERECAFILRRLNRDWADADPEAFHIVSFLRPGLDMKIWGFAFIFLLATPYDVFILKKIITDIFPAPSIPLHTLLHTSSQLFSVITWDSA